MTEQLDLGPDYQCREHRGRAMNLQLMPDEVAELLKPRGGEHASGGAQNRFRKWKRALDPVTFVITLDRDDVLFIRRTIPNFRTGGYQLATKKIFERPLRERDLRAGTAW